VSGGEPIRLQKMVEADQAIIGTRQSVWVLADDEVDMLMKGRVTDIRVAKADGTGSVVENEGNSVSILSTASDFTAILAIVKRMVTRRADSIEDTRSGLRFLTQRSRISSVNG
jgi:hypothetical protein